MPSLPHEGLVVRLVLELGAALGALLLSWCGPDLHRIEACDLAYQECVKDSTTKAEYLECRSEVDRECSK